MRKYKGYANPVNDEPNSSSSMGCIMLMVVIALVCYSVFLLLKEIDQPVLAAGTKTRAKISWYWPPLLGLNCAVVKNGECVSRMASGRPWQKWVGQAVACPPEYPFGTEFIIEGRRWVCLDRGGAIQRVNGNTIWLDMLTSKPLYKFGKVVDVTVVTRK